MKMSELLPTITERMQENIMFENVRKSHPQKMPPVVIELNKEINVKLIAVGFSKFIGLCSPGKYIKYIYTSIYRRYIIKAHLKYFLKIFFIFQKILDNSGFKIIIFIRCWKVQNGLNMYHIAYKKQLKLVTVLI